MTENLAENFVLTQLEGETNQAYGAFLDYVAMGRGRSLPKLHKRYTESNTSEVPTKHLTTLKVWSTENKWQKRLSDYLAEQAQAQAIVDTERMSGFTENAWEDYYAIRDLLKRQINNAKEMSVTKRSYVADPTDKTKQIEAVYMRVNTKELKEIVQAYAELNKSASAALGIPTAAQKFAESQNESERIKPVEMVEVDLSSMRSDDRQTQSA